MTGPTQRRPARLTIGDVFKYDDPVAHWMFSVTALAEDLTVSIAPSRRATADGDLRALLFWHRNSVTRLYEANRLAMPASLNSEVKEFVGSLLANAPGGANLIAAYTKPSPDEPSPVQDLYGRLRHLTVHYSHVGKKELAQTLEKYAYLPAQAKLRQSPSGTTEFTFGWVQGVRAMEVVGDITREDFLEKLKADGAVTGSIAASWLMVVPVALALYCMKYGIDLEELVDADGWQPPPQPIRPE